MSANADPHGWIADELDWWFETATGLSGAVPCGLTDQIAAALNDRAVTDVEEAVAALLSEAGVPGDRRVLACRLHGHMAPAFAR